MSNFGDHPAGFFGVSGFYNGVATQSVRFDYGSDPNLNITNSGAPTLNTKGTLSFWYKRGIQGSGTGQNQYLIHTGTGTADNTHMDLKIETGDALSIGAYGTTPFSNSRLLRDGSAWYHIVVAFDSTSGTASERLIKVYVNSVAQTGTFGAVAQNQQFPWINASQAIYIGRHASVNRPMDGYLAEWNLIDGQALTPASFGETKNGIWIPIEYTGTYGNNGARLQFNQVGVGTASTSTIGADTSGNTNHWTSSGIAASDCNIPDSPENNFCVLGGAQTRRYGQSYNSTMSEGNLKAASGGNASHNFGTMAINQVCANGGVYFEIRNVSIDGNRNYGGVIGDNGINNKSGDANGASYSFPIKGLIGLMANPRGYFNTATDASGSLDLTANANFVDEDVIGFAIKSDGKFFVHRNGTYLNNADGNTGNPSTGANPIATIDLTLGDWVPYCGYNSTLHANFGQDGTFNATETSGGNSDANGFGDFMFAVPTGYLALCSDNMAEPTIGPNSLTQSDENFNAVLYTSDNIGANGTQNVTGVGFKPDWVWLKNRSSDSTSHTLYDSNRGTGRHLPSDDAAVEVGLNSQYGYLGTFGNDGFTLRGGSTNANFVNQSTDAYVSWNWKANGGTTVTNTDGSIDTTVQANTTAGFSIVTFEGNDTKGATIGHGLGVKPDLIIMKGRDQTISWVVWFPKFQENNQLLELNSTGSLITNTSDVNHYWNNTAPTSTLITLGDYDGTNYSASMLAYCFKEIEGYSKFGNYNGNDATDGAFVYTGFAPAFLILKYSSGSAGGTKNWLMFDNKRSPNNVNDNTFNANAADGETADSNKDLDFLSNGFKLRNAEGPVNNAANYVYLAFAEAPFKYANAQ